MFTVNWTSDSLGVRHQNIWVSRTTPSVARWSPGTTRKCVHKICLHNCRLLNRKKQKLILWTADNNSWWTSSWTSVFSSEDCLVCDVKEEERSSESLCQTLLLLDPASPKAGISPDLCFLINCFWTKDLKSDNHSMLRLSQLRRPLGDLSYVGLFGCHFGLASFF